jgi:hypothetical protein
LTEGSCSVGHGEGDGAISPRTLQKARSGAGKARVPESPLIDLVQAKELFVLNGEADPVCPAGTTLAGPCLVWCHCNVEAAGARTKKRINQSALFALREALAVIYWFKPDLEAFVGATVPAHEILARLNFSDTKRVVAAELVNLLAADQDKYMQVLLELMGEVAAFDDFSHLARLEDGRMKVDQAQRAVANLRKQYEGHAIIRAEREAAEERRRARRESGDRVRADREKLSEFQQRAMALLSEDRQKRGYELEILLRDLFDLFDLDPKASFKIVGEQIDGAFTFEGIDYLLEARWQEEQVDPAALDVFDGKIRRKLENTLGLFVAVNGFSDTAIGNHSRSRPTMILMDGSDLWAVLEARVALTEMLRRKRRHAAQTGEILFRISGV